MGVPEGWQLLHPPWLSHLLLPLGLQNAAGFCSGFSKYLLTLICFFFAFLFSAPLEWAYALRELGKLEKDKHKFAGSAGELSARGSARTPCTQGKKMRLIMLYHRQSSCLHQVFSAVNFKKGGKKIQKNRAKQRRHGVRMTWGSGGSMVVLVVVLKEQ